MLTQDYFKVILFVLSVFLLIGAANSSEVPVYGNYEWLNSKNAKFAADGVYNPYRDFNQWINSMLMPKGVIEYIHNQFSEEIAYYLCSYLRDFVMGTLVYWVTAGAWHIVIYDILGDKLFTKQNRPFPTSATIIESMVLAQSSIFLYAGLPVLSELLIEGGITRSYFYIDEVGGWLYYFINLALYITFVEIGIYWVHRTLHTNKFLYKYIHGLHHKFNKPTTLTPWTSIAFNPIDGLLQASPYVVGLFIFRVHYFTHVFLLFFSGVWATNIHDAVPANFEPIMGAKYHTIHHTHYHYNFGQWFTFCDRYWGSLRTPEEIQQMSGGKKKAH